MRHAANIAEARERELQERMASMIAELRGVPRYQDDCSGGDSYMFTSKSGDYIEHCDVEATINKYEVKE